MNMVKRIMGRPRQEECSPQDNALGLMHLRRLFTELCHPPRHMTQKEQEEKLYVMLPVFNRVFGNAPPNTMTEKFSDLLQFTTQVSRLMVTEIRRRASNKSTGSYCDPGWPRTPYVDQIGLDHRDPPAAVPQSWD